MDLNDILPVGERVVIKAYESATQSAAGLAMENTANTSVAPVMGTVVTAGDGSRFKKGQELMFRRYSTDVLKVITPEGEKEVMLVDDEDVLAIVSTKGRITKTKK